jgi:hypothetical protein
MAGFFPLPRRGGIPRGKQKSRPTPSSALLRAKWLRADRSPGQGPPSRLRWSRPDNRTETTMATIGTFTAADNGYTGSVKTLTLNVKAKFVATEKDNDKAPDYRIFAGATDYA